MKTIRGKLFVGVGLILVIVALLSYFVPHFYIKKDIGEASKKLAERIEALAQRPLVLEGETLFLPNGTEKPLSEASQEVLKYRRSAYTIGGRTLYVLTPTPDPAAIPKAMEGLSDQLVQKLSLNLISIALVVFLIALILLARLSKRITRPIAQLARASEEIGQGRLEGVALPDISHRDDEIAVLTHAFEGMVGALREREQIRGALNKVVSKEVATQILKSEIELGGEERVVTLLFSDIRNFTPLSNHYAPKELIAMLNRYMTHMCHIIDANHGVVDKFVGDEIMALYGAPLEMTDQADRALETARKMIEDLKAWNAEHEKRLEIGIGIHTGPVCAGNMGGESRLNYTVIGANVNLAARMCAAAAPMQILVTRETINTLTNPTQYAFEQLPPKTLKGFEKPITLYALK